MASSDSVFVVAITDNNVDIILWELQCIDTEPELAVEIVNTRRVLILGNRYVLSVHPQAATGPLTTHK